MQTDAPTLLHPFELSGLGRAPFRCIGLISNPPRGLAHANPRAYTEACAQMAQAIKRFGVETGRCQHCGMPLSNNYVIESADGLRHVVGCDCVQKCGDGKLILQVNRERLAREQAKRAEKKRERIANAETARRERIAKARADFMASNGPLFWEMFAQRNASRFVRSIVEQFFKFGRISDAQIAAFRKLGLAQANRDARNAAQEAERARELASSRHVGTVGGRIEATLTLKAIIHGGSVWEPWALKIMQDETGARLTTFGQCPLKMDTPTKCKFSIKAHGEHKGVKTTSILRLKPCAS